MTTGKSTNGIFSLSSEYPVNLIFKIDGAVSPKSLGFGQENRKFGLIFNSLRITPDD